MTRDDIIRMYEKANGWSPAAYAITLEELERFAALVAAAEREAMIEQGWRQCAKDQRTTQFCGMVEQAVLAEREACAKVCEEKAKAWKAAGYFGSTADYGECAAAIRARGQA